MYLALERYSRPATVEEALRLFAEGGDCVFLAGGTELNVRDHEAIEHVIDLQALPLGEIVWRSPPGADPFESTVAWESIEIGALATLSDVRAQTVAGASKILTAVREAAGGYANVALQNRSTVGGRVMQPRGDQDLPPALAAVGAKLHLARLSGDAVKTSVIDYPLGDRSELEGALLTKIEIPQRHARSAHRRFGRSAVDAPLACVSACKLDRSLRLVANVQGPGAASMVLLKEAQALVDSWNGERPADWRAQLRNACLEELPSYACSWVSAGYRRDLTATLAVRATAAVLGEEEIA